MNKENYNATIVVKKSPAEALTAISQVSNWWAKNTKGNTEKLNDVFTVDFGETFVTFKITEFIPDYKTVWFVTDCYLHWIEDKKEWVDTEVVWEISRVDDSTHISMTHVGLTPEVVCYGDCKKGWDEHVKESLFNLLTNGEGSPQ